MTGPRLLRTYAPGGAKAGTIRVLDPLPFAPRRLFWIDVPWAGTRRAGHAHRTNAQFVVVLRGTVMASCTWWTDAVWPDRPRKRSRSARLTTGSALLVPSRTWLELRFDAPGLVVVLASESYRASSYINTLDELRKLALDAHP